MQNSGQVEAEICWQARADDSLHWESWGEQHAVFDSLSGETHLLPDLTARILRKLDDRNCTARLLAESLCQETGDRCSEEVVIDITRVLQQLHAVGLVGKSSP